MEDTKKIRNRLKADSAQYVLSSGPTEWKQMLRLTYTLEDFDFLRRESVVRHRDLGMKENIDWMLEHEGPDSKILVWAHNAHVMYDSFPFNTLPGKDKGYFKGMGLCLKDFYGHEVYTIGFDFNRGRFLANKPTPIGGKALTVYTIAAAPVGTLANALSKMDSNITFIDIGTVSKHKEVRDKWDQPVLMRHIGGMMAEVCVIEQSCGFVPTRLLQAFDGLLFVNETLAVTRLK
jgi:erythromycin esterase